MALYYTSRGEIQKHIVMDHYGITAQSANVMAPMKQVITKAKHLLPAANQKTMLQR